jgi:hypothetical protein
MKPGMPPELLDLMLRFCQLGHLLPPKEDIKEAVQDPDARASLELVTREMDLVRAQIDEFLDRAKAEREAKS